MKKRYVTRVIFSCLLILSLGAIQMMHAQSEPIRPLQIGQKMPHADHKMQDTHYNMLSPSMVKKDNGVLILFTANTCGVADEWQDRYNMIAQACSANNIGMMAVNPNAALIRGPASVEKNKEHAQKYHYRFPYVSDKHDELTNAFGVKQIPIAYLFNQDMKLVYRGAIDDDPDNPGQVKNHYVMDAITSLGNGKTVSRAITKVNGCPVMRETD